MKLFIFDMGGVVTANVACIPDMAEHLGIGVDEFFRAAGSDPSVADTSPYNLGDVAELQRGAISPETFWARFNSRTGFGVMEDLWGTFFEPKPDAGTYAVIGALRARGRRVVCGTNSLHAHYELHVAAGHYDCFDAVYASHKMGVAKPDAAFWRRILDAEGVSAADAFFVDDSAENIKAAAALGLGTHHFTDSAALAREFRAWTGGLEVRA